REERVAGLIAGAARHDEAEREEAAEHASHERPCIVRYPRVVAKRQRVVRRDADAFFATRKRPKKIPFDFVLAELEELGPVTRPMFGCHAVYVDDKIVFILRDKSDPRDDDG